MLQKAITDYVRPGMIVYEVGAHIGYITLMFARAVKTGKVFAFEPLPANVERLRVNTALNDADQIGRLIPMAVSDETGNVRFLVHDRAAMGKLDGVHGRSVSYVANLDVPAIRLDDFVFYDLNPPPNLVKMDIEGGGERAIPGMERILREARPICLLELHGPEEGRVAWLSLRRHKYTVHKMASGYPEIQDERRLRWKEYIVGLPQQ